MRWLKNLRSSTALLRRPEHLVHVGDQEGDIFDLFGVAQQLGTHFLVRTRSDRLTDGGPETVAEAVERTLAGGLYRGAVRSRKGEESETVLAIRYRRLRIQTAKSKNKRYPELMVTVIEAREQQKPADRERIDWKLVTDLTVNSRRQAVEKVQWYALRCKIEVFHKILKSGWHVVKHYAKEFGVTQLAPHDLRRSCANLCHATGGELEQIQFLLGHVSVQTTERYLGCKQRIRGAVNDNIGIEPSPWNSEAGTDCRTKRESSSVTAHKV